MDCKLSKYSLIELQLIQPELVNDDALCPCCQQKVVEHRNGRRKLIYFQHFNYNELKFFIISCRT